MFSYVFMKILERRPRSYDRRMETVSKGRIGELKRAVAAEIQPGTHVLEIGCGTGELAAMMVSRGATVEGFDLSPSMVAAAGGRIQAEGLGDRLTVRQMGVDGMDELSSCAYTAVVATLVFSELTDDERRFALKHALRILKHGGRLIIADEVLPLTKVRRILYWLMRAPILVATYLAARTSTKPIADLIGEVVTSGFIMDREVRSHGDAFCLLVAHRPKEGVLR